MTWSGVAPVKPILIGAALLKDYLCKEIALPADNATPPAAEVTPTMTEREKVVAITEVPGSDCISCHASNTQINGKGFCAK